MLNSHPYKKAKIGNNKTPIFAFIPKMNPSTELIQDTIAGNRKAQLELYKLCFGTLMGVARRYKKNDEDQQTLVNNAYIKIVTSLERYEDKSSFYGWIKRIVMNEVIDDYRRNKKYYEFINQDKAVEKMELVEYSESDYIHSEEELLNMIETLPKATKLVFNLFAIDGYSHKEICEQLGIGEETTKWHMKEARKKLKSLLEKNVNHEQPQ